MCFWKSEPFKWEWARACVQPLWWLCTMNPRWLHPGGGWQTKTTPDVRSQISPNPMANYFPWLRLDMKQMGWNQLWETFSFQVVPLLIGWGWFTGCCTLSDVWSPFSGCLQFGHCTCLSPQGAPCEPEVLWSYMPALSQEQQLCQDQSGFLLRLPEDASKDIFFLMKIRFHSSWG